MELNNGLDKNDTVCEIIFSRPIQGVVKLSRKAGDPPFNEKDEQILEVCYAFTLLRFVLCYYMQAIV